MTKRAALTYMALISTLLLFVAGWYFFSFKNAESNSAKFDGGRAYADVETQVAFGPRTPGSEGHVQIQAWIRTELEAAGWVVEVHQTEQMGHPVYNIIAKRDDNTPPVIIIGAHYDTRLIADHDPKTAHQDEPVPGANDGASGVAVLLELARSLPEDIQPTWLVFFDAEDNGRIEGWSWILGSTAFVQELKIQPKAVVIVDMIGDADLNIYLEKNSNKELRSEIWSTAESLGYGDIFINEEKYNMLDDHRPFLDAGIPAIDIIDFDYPHWHTTGDTPDKVSAKSLQIVGDTLWHWVVGRSVKE